MRPRRRGSVEARTAAGSSPSARDHAFPASAETIPEPAPATLDNTGWDAPSNDSDMTPPVEPTTDKTGAAGERAADMCGTFCFYAQTNAQKCES